MSEQTVLVIRGTLDVGDASPTARSAQMLVERQAPGFGGRTFKHRRLFRAGERVELSAGDAARLVQAGIVEIVP